MKPDLYAKAVLTAIAIMFGVACDSKNAPKAAQPAFTTETIMFGGSTRGNFYHSLGLAIVAHATGTVSYCEDKCLEIGTIAPVGPNEVKIHNADSYDWDKWWVRFFVANVVNGAVTVCEVQRDKKERLSGSCKDLVTASMGGPTVNDQKK